MTIFRGGTLFTFFLGVITMTDGCEGVPRFFPLGVLLVTGSNFGASGVCEPFFFMSGSKSGVFDLFGSFTAVFGIRSKISGVRALRRGVASGSATETSVAAIIF